MTGLAWAVVFALFCWWFGTGLVFLLERWLRSRPRASIGTIAAIGALSLFGIDQSSRMPQAAGAYLGFAASIALWGALELSFLTGLVTGLRPRGCAHGCRGLRHFGHGVLALLHHELALAGCAILVAVVCWDRANPTAACTFTLLWVMRESAKMNLFLGVANPAVELLPQRLAHLACYFGRRGVNAFLPVSIAAATIADALLVRHALDASATPREQIAGVLLGALLALAILEHLLLVLPVRADALWTWATRRRPRSNGPTGGDAMPRAAQGQQIEAEVVPAIGARLGA
jgi:putative photosynthetic complex assembly protein 2